MKEIRQLGKHEVQVGSGDDAQILEGRFRSRDKGRQGEPEKPEFPEDTIDSLRPLLRPIFANAFDDEAHWAEKVANARLDPQVAVNRLRNAGKGRLEVAKVLVTSDPLVAENTAFHRLSQEQIDEKVVEAAAILLPYYNYNAIS